MAYYKCETGAFMYGRYIEVTIQYNKYNLAGNY